MTKSTLIENTSQQEQICRVQEKDPVSILHFSWFFFLQASSSLVPGTDHPLRATAHSCMHSWNTFPFASSGRNPVCKLQVCSTTQTKAQISRQDWGFISKAHVSSLQHLAIKAASVHDPLLEISPLHPISRWVHNDISPWLLLLEEGIFSTPKHYYQILS